MSGVSDLVQDSKLDTRFHQQYVCHVYHDSDSRQGQRAVQRREYWRRTKLLGSGGYGSVWLEQCFKGPQAGELRAVKEIQRPRTKFECNRELEAIAKFSHSKYARCFVKSFGWYEADNILYLAMEYFPRGDLQSYLSDTPEPLAESEVQQIAYQLLEGLKFMHENGFAHRDIKPANILVQSRPPEETEWWVKLVDFGISKRFRDIQGISSTIKGTLAFMAPELHGFSSPGHDLDPAAPNAVDMWALGEVVFQLLTNQPVFNNMASLLKYTQGIEGFPDAPLRQRAIGLEAASFINQVMRAAPYTRITAEQGLQCIWLSHLRPPPSPPPEELELPEIPDMLSSIQIDDEASAKWSTLELTTEEHTCLPKESTRRFNGTSQRYLENETVAHSSATRPTGDSTESSEDGSESTGLRYTHNVQTHKSYQIDHPRLQTQARPSEHDGAKLVTPLSVESSLADGVAPQAGPSRRPAESLTSRGEISRLSSGTGPSLTQEPDISFPPNTLSSANAGTVMDGGMDIPPDINLTVKSAHSRMIFTIPSEFSPSLTILKAFSPDSFSYAAVSTEGIIGVWAMDRKHGEPTRVEYTDEPKKQRISRLWKKEQPLSSKVCLAICSSQIVHIMSDGTITEGILKGRWHCVRFRCKTIHRGGDICHVEFSRNGNAFLACRLYAEGVTFAQKFGELWESFDYRPYDPHARSHEPRVFSATLSPDGKRLAVGVTWFYEDQYLGSEIQIVTWGPKGWAPVHKKSVTISATGPGRIEREKYFVNFRFWCKMLYSPDGELLVLSTPNSTVVLNARRPTSPEDSMIQRYLEKQGPLDTYPLAFSQDSKLLAVLRAELHIVEIWDCQTKAIFQVQLSQGDYTPHVLGPIAFLPSGELVAVCQDKDRPLYNRDVMVELATAEEIREIVRH